MRLAHRHPLYPLLALSLGLLLGCDGTPIPGQPQPPGPPGDGGVPVTSDPETSLYPLTQGSTWTYRVTEAGAAPFEKHLEVVGEAPIPGRQGATATLVRSVQPHLQEEGFLTEREGLVMRVHEEDLKAGVLARTTTWDPATIKSLATSREVGWATSHTTTETVRFPAGDVEEKEEAYVWRVTAVETVTVPAGTFEAVRLERTRPDKPEKLRTYWLVPGVGKVKETGERLEELLSYDVRPRAP